MKIATSEDYEKQRDSDTQAILNSPSDKKVIVAGPGTGKSYLFEKFIQKKIDEGKSNFLAITFVGKLGDFLADDLAGIAKTKTLHGFAREFVLDEYQRGWKYLPKAYELIKNDLSINGIDEFTIGDKNYMDRSSFYRVAGDDDVVRHAINICEEDETKIPTFDLILIDEFQDFNEAEAEFIHMLSTKNQVVIVGDDDQALYEFKGSSPKYIRNIFSEKNKYFESHVLRFCSRCTNVIIESFHDIISYFKLKETDKDRVDKDYMCYLPEKGDDSKNNPQLLLMRGTPPGMIAYKIHQELEYLLSEQKVKSVLVIGEGQTCRDTLRAVGRQLSEYGFKNVDYSDYLSKVYKFKQRIVDGYKILAAGDNDLLAWRLLLEELDEKTRNKLISTHYRDPDGLINALPDDFREKCVKNSKTLKRVLEGSKSSRSQIADSSIDQLKEELVAKEKENRNIFTDQLLSDFKHIPRPLVNLDITVCSILGSKGLGADVVFIIGFDDGKLPAKAKPRKSEIYQMLVALTRAKKRVYLVNTVNKPVSQFIKGFKSKNIKQI